MSEFSCIREEFEKAVNKLSDTTVLAWQQQRIGANIFRNLLKTCGYMMLNVVWARSSEEMGLKINGNDHKYQLNHSAIMLNKLRGYFPVDDANLYETCEKSLIRYIEYCDAQGFFLQDGPSVSTPEFQAALDNLFCQRQLKREVATLQYNP